MKFTIVAELGSAKRPGPTAAPPFIRSKTMLNVKIVSLALATTTLVSFLLCIAYGLVTPERLHMHTLLEQVLPGFKWLTWQGFAIGFVESFLWGAYAGLVYVPIYNFFARRFAR
ncbi:MAG: DUF5676 family membrane protein [Rubrivivax sp.]